MISFKEVMAVTERVSSHTAFEDAECEAYFDLATSLRPNSNILEIGLQFGRSTSIVAQVAAQPENRHWLYGVDPWVDPPDARDAWLKLIARWPEVGVTLFNEKTEVAVCDAAFPNVIHLALIDGDHNEGAVRADCEAVLPRMAAGGFVTFHDYSHDSLPDVYPTVRREMVQSIMRGQRFIELTPAGTLGIWMRL